MRHERESHKRIMIPGSVILAMLMAMIDVRGWLEMEILQKAKETIEGGEVKKEAKGEAIMVPGVELKILEETAYPLKTDPFGKFTRFYILSYASDQDVLNELEYEVNLRVYGLISSLTPRENEVLRKRIVERKGVTETASEMGVTPQAVITFITSIRRKVQKHLFKD